MLELFSVAYFIWLISAVLLFFGLHFLIRNKSEKFKYWFLFSLTILAWIIHFSRIWLDPNMKTYELFMKDMCGFSTLVYPFFFLMRHKSFKDYMYFIGGFFAAHSLFYPDFIFGDPLLQFNSIRFFFAHFILVSIPLYLIIWKMHKPSLKSIPYMLVFVLVSAMYNFTLSTVFYEIGLTNIRINFMGLQGNYNDIYQYAELLAPPFLYYDAEIGGETVRRVIPFFYMIPTLIIVYIPVWTIMSLPFLKRKEKMIEN